MTLDEIRTRFPFLAVAVYAFEPGGPVTVEVVSGETTYTKSAPTEAEALAALFPEAPPPAPINVFD